MRAMALGLILCLLAGSAGASAPVPATLPPQESPAVGAPLARLDNRIIVPDPRATSLRQVAIGEETVGLIGQITLESGVSVDALWLYDPFTGLICRRYEAPQGVQMVSLVYCQGDYYWAQWREDQSGKWEILVLRQEADRIETLRTDPYEESQLAPTLTTDTEHVYWYESEKGYVQTPPYQMLQATLYRAGPEEGPRALREVVTANDWAGPAVHGSLLAFGVYDEQTDGWGIEICDLFLEDRVERIAVQGMPVSLSLDDDHLLWRQGGEDADIEGQSGALEEDGMPQTLAGALSWNGSLMLRNLETGETRRVDVDVEKAILGEFGVLYVNGSGELLCYSYTLARLLRLLPAADVAPTLDAAGDRLWTLRRIWIGAEVLYRPLWLDISPLADGWPELM